MDIHHVPGFVIAHADVAAQGLVEGVDFTSRRYDGADHSERAWRARVGDALAFLLPAPGDS